MSFRPSVCLSVCPFVCLSVLYFTILLYIKHWSVIHTLKMHETCKMPSLLKPQTKLYSSVIKGILKLLS